MAGPTESRQANCSLPGLSGPALSSEPSADEATSVSGRICQIFRPITQNPEPKTQSSWLCTDLPRIIHRVSRLVLASASPRRAELLSAAGFVFDVVPAAIDETLRAGESAADHVTRLAAEKARTVDSADSRPVLGADTEVVIDGRELGKPRDREDAARMLRLLSGRTHQVLTGVAICLGERLVTECVISTVTVAPLSASEIEWYVATGEPLDKAGAYAVQGRASRFIARIEGSYSNVVGLPIETVYRLLKRLGLD
ncbi:MAG: septum formation inhibitor Maf [Acidobacteria bacterium]|nr:septum formation inhibitor Maf [Acidobacteriota bacterium]